MPTFDLKRLFLPTTLENSIASLNPVSSFDTYDRFYLKAGEKYNHIRCNDYAVMCGADYNVHGAKNWFRTADPACPTRVLIRNEYGDLDTKNPEASGITIAPVLRVDINAFLEYRELLFQLGYNPNDIIKQLGNEHVVHLGLTFPSDKNYLNSILDKSASATGATYSGFYEDGVGLVKNQECDYGGNKYVRVKVKRFDRKSCFNDYTECPKTGEFVWAEVRPIDFTITNWNDLPRTINPNGKGKTNYMEVVAKEGMLTMPFNLNSKKHSPETAMWQNSLIRAWLNGYDLHKEIDHGNGNRNYKADINFNYEGRGFLYEASQNLRARHKEIVIGDGTERTTTVQTPVPQPDQTPRPNPYGFHYDALENDDLLQLYIQSKTPVFLHGPSGVGKSSRVKQIDPNPTHITLRPQMNPEEVDGTLDRATGKYIPPLWYTQLCEKCEKDPEHIHTLFIDELTNVKPTVQSLVYSIILDRAGKDGLWPLPDNSVVVAAGNENADNLAAYPLTNALFRRFSHIYYEIDKEKWLDWAMGVNKLSRLCPVVPDKTNQARVHPALVAFVASQKENVLYQELDEEKPEIVTDPRKWEIASNVLYTTKNPKALEPALGKEITASFTDFVQSINLTVADVRKGLNAQQIVNISTMNFAQKYANAVGLCSATEKDLPVVRQFIQQYFGQEVRALFDSLWIRNDPKRALIIGELDESMTIKQKDDTHDIER